MRQVQHGKYRIIFRIDPQRVVVLTVRHDALTWDAADVEPDEDM